MLSLAIARLHGGSIEGYLKSVQGKASAFKAFPDFLCGGAAKGPSHMAADRAIRPPAVAVFGIALTAVVAASAGIFQYIDNKNTAHERFSALTREFTTLVENKRRGSSRRRVWTNFLRSTCANLPRTRASVSSSSTSIPSRATKGRRALILRRKATGALRR